MIFNPVFNCAKTNRIELIPVVLLTFLIFLGSGCNRGEIIDKNEFLPLSIGTPGKDFANAIYPITDGGIIIAGSSLTANADSETDSSLYDGWLEKTDNTGSVIWDKSYGGSGSDNFRTVEQTADGGFIAAGLSNSHDGVFTGNHGDFDCWILKTDKDGNMQWQRTLGGSNSDDAIFIRQTRDLGYIMAGGSRSDDGDLTGNHGNYDVWVVKMDSNGNMKWQKNLGGSKRDGASCIQQTMDEGYIIAGITDSSDGDVSGNHGGTDAWIIKLDASGNMQWQRSLGGSAEDEANYINQTPDGGYIIAGASRSQDGDVLLNHGDEDFWVVKLSSSGNPEWERSLGGSGNDEANIVQITSDKGYLVAGFSSSMDRDVTGNQGHTDGWVLKLSSSGNLIWEQSLGGPYWDEILAAEPDRNGNWNLLGFTDENGIFSYWIDIINNNGDQVSK